MYQLQRHTENIAIWHVGLILADILLKKNNYCKTKPKAYIMVERNRILTKVKEHIDKELDPAIINFYDRTKEVFVKTKSITEILQELEILKADHENLSVSSNDDYELQLQSIVLSGFINVCSSF